MVLPLFTPEEKQFIPGSGQQMGDINGSADRVSRIVVTVERPGQTTNVVDEAVGVKIVVTMVDVAAAVKITGAARLRGRFARPHCGHIQPDAHPSVL